jgi:hypothetical protein
MDSGLVLKILPKIEADMAIIKRDIIAIKQTMLATREDLRRPPLTASFRRASGTRNPV